MFQGAKLVHRAKRPRSELPRSELLRQPEPTHYLLGQRPGWQMPCILAACHTQSEAERMLTGPFASLEGYERVWIEEIRHKLN